MMIVPVGAFPVKEIDHKDKAQRHENDVMYLHGYDILMVS